jgi:hypothetical protein
MSEKDNHEDGQNYITRGFITCIPFLTILGWINKKEDMEETCSTDAKIKKCI